MYETPPCVKELEEKHRSSAFNLHRVFVTTLCASARAWEMHFFRCAVLTCHPRRKGYQALQRSKPFARKHCNWLRIVLPNQRDHQGSLEFKLLLAWIITRIKLHFPHYFGTVNNKL